MNKILIKLLALTACLILITSCGTTHKATNTSQTDNNPGIEVKVWPERNGGAPDVLELTIKNNTSQVIQFGANYLIERFVNDEWIAMDLGNFAVIAIMYNLQPGDSGKYTISLFTENVAYPEGDYRVVKQINIGEESGQPFYANFKIIEPR